jgi:hypothetical protein
MASRFGPARPRAIGWNGAGGWVIASQDRQGAEALVAQLGDQQLQVHHHRLRPRGPRLGLAAGELLGRQSGA